MDEHQAAALLVGSIPPVVRYILENLSAKQLNKCSQVCTLWRDIAKTIKKRRHRISKFEFDYYNKEATTYSHYGAWFARGRYHSCLDGFHQHLNNLCSQPSLVLIFCSQLMVCQTEPSDFSVQARKQNLEIGNRSQDDSPPLESPLHQIFSSLQPFFPKECYVGCCTSYGVIKASLYTSEGIMFCPSLSILYMPPLPGVNVHTFSLNTLQCAAPYIHSSHTGIPRNTPVKCMLMFLNDPESDVLKLPYNKFIDQQLEKHDWKMALGGAYIDCISFSKENPSQNDQCYGIAFTGKNVEAASIVITKEMLERGEYKEQFRLIANSGLIKGQCIAFMFISMEREEDFRECYGFESSQFHRFMPGIPLFVISCGEEIGINYVPNRETKQRRYDCSWIHSYSSVFVVISMRT